MMRQIAQPLIIPEKRPKLSRSLRLKWQCVYWVEWLFTKLTWKSAALHLWAAISSPTPSHSGPAVANRKFVALAQDNDETPATYRAFHQHFFRNTGSSVSKLQKCEPACACQPQFLSGRGGLLVIRHPACQLCTTPAARGSIEKIAFAGREDEFYSWVIRYSVEPHSFSLPQIYSVQTDRGFSRIVMEDVGTRRLSYSDVRQQVSSIATAAAEINLLPTRDPDPSRWTYDGTGPAQIGRTLSLMRSQALARSDEELSELLPILEDTAQFILGFSKATPFLFCHGDLHNGNIVPQDPILQLGPALRVLDWGACGYSFVGSDLYSVITTFPEEAALHDEAVGVYRDQLHAGGLTFGSQEILQGAFSYAFLNLARGMIRGGRPAGYRARTLALGRRTRQLLSRRGKVSMALTAWASDVQTCFSLLIAA